MATAALRAEPMGVRSRSFKISLVPLTQTERIAMECLRQIALEGREATQDEIRAGIGSENQCGSTASGVLKRLYEKGEIEDVLGHPIQRGIWVRLVKLGLVTGQPRDLTPHWRFRTDRTPSPAIQSVRERAKPVAAMIEAEARLLGKSLSDFLSDLAYIGWHEYQAEKERGE